MRVKPHRLRTLKFICNFIRSGMCTSMSIKSETINKTYFLRNWMFSMLRELLLQVSVVGAVYLVGYMQWSVAWLIGPVILSVLRDQWRKENEYRRNLAKAAASSSEKDVVLAKLDDLPAWVRCYLLLYRKQVIYILD